MLHLRNIHESGIGKPRRRFVLAAQGGRGIRPGVVVMGDFDGAIRDDRSFPEICPKKTPAQGGR